MKLYQYFIIGLFIAMAMIGYVNATACSGAPVEDCTIATNTLYQMPSGGSYHLNDSNANAAIGMFAANSTLDCNGSLLYGDNISGSIGVKSSQNIAIIKNCNFRDYDAEILTSFQNNNVTIFNDNFLGYSGTGYLKAAIYLEATTNVTIYNNNFSSPNDCIAGYSWVQEYIYNNKFVSCNHFVLDGGTGFDKQQVLFYNNTVGNKDSNVSNSIIRFYSNAIGLNQIYNNFFYGNKFGLVGNSYIILSGNNSIIHDNTIAFNQSLIPSNSVYGIDILPTGYNNSIYNNNISAIDALNIEGNNCSVYNNILFNKNGTSVSNGYSEIFIPGSSNRIYLNNIKNTYDQLAQINNWGNYNSIYNNTLFNETNIYSIYENGQNNLIENNSINLSDVGIHELGKNNIINNNTWINQYVETDNWGLGIFVESANNITITRNSVINNSGCSFYIHNSTNVLINNNYINPMSPAYKLASGYSADQGEVVGAICINEVYRNYDSLITDDLTANITALTKTKSINVTVIGNIISNNSQFFIRSEGTTNLVQDLSSSTYWYRSFQFPYFQDKVELWNNNFYNNLTQYSDSGLPHNQILLAFRYWRFCGGSSFTPCNATNNISNTRWNYTISNIQINFSNNANIANNVSIFSASLYYPYNDVKNVSNGVVLASNIDNYSISLVSGQQIIVGNYSSLSVSGTDGTIAGNTIYATINVTDPDGIFNNITFYIYDSGLNLLYTNVSYSLNTYVSYTLPAGTYYGRFIVYDNKSGTYDSGYSPALYIGSTTVATSCHSPAAAMILAFTEIPANWLTLIFVMIAVSVIIGVIIYALKQGGQEFGANSLDIILYSLWPAVIGCLIFIIAILILQSMC